MNADKFAAIVARVGELPHGALASRQQTLTRWRVSFADGASVVVMATDEDAARRAGAFFSFGAVIDVEVVR